MKVEDFPWAEFLTVRAKFIYWLRLYGNEGEPMGFDEIAKSVSCDPTQVELIYEMRVHDEAKGDEETGLEPAERRISERGPGETRREYEEES